MEGSIFRTAADGNHILRLIRDRDGNRVYGEVAGYLYPEYTSVPVRKGCDELDFTKESRHYIRTAEKSPAGRIFEGARRIK